jgi:hypothetical protein
MEDTEVREAKERNKDRGRAEGHRRLMADYFDTPSVYSAKDFRRRFRMSRRLFLHVMDRVCVADPWFVQKPDCTGLLGLSSHQKVTSAMRQLAYGISADATDEYVRIGESTAREALKRFCRAIRAAFEQEFLRHPTQEEIDRYTQLNARRGLPSMFGSIDCSGWIWKNTPMAHQGQHLDKNGDASIVMEAMVSPDLRFWHAAVGFPGSNNDITILDKCFNVFVVLFCAYCFLGGL